MWVTTRVRVEQGVTGRPARSSRVKPPLVDSEAVPQAPPLTCWPRPSNQPRKWSAGGRAQVQGGCGWGLGREWQARAGRGGRAQSAPPLGPRGGAWRAAGGRGGGGAGEGGPGRGGRAAGAGPRSSLASRSHGRPRLPALPLLPRAAPRGPALTAHGAARRSPRPALSRRAHAGRPARAQPRPRPRTR